MDEFADEMLEKQDDNTINEELRSKEEFRKKAAQVYQLYPLSTTIVLSGFVQILPRKFDS